MTHRKQLFALPLLALLIWACTGGAGPMLQDAGQAMIDLGTALETDAGAQTPPMRWVLPCRDAGGGVEKAISDPISFDPAQAENIFVIGCNQDRSRCSLFAWEIRQSRFEVACGGFSDFMFYITARL